MGHGTAPRFAFTLPHHDDELERITLGIIALYKELSSLPSLEPNPENGKLFNQLFDLVTMSKTTVEGDNKILNDHRITAIIPGLWDLWGSAEYLLEKDFARKVVTGSSQTECIKLYNTFPYLDQYRQLARMETNTLDTALGEKGLPTPKNFAFLGSGPTPFTALCFQERYHDPSSKYLNIDRNPEANAHAFALVERCGFPNVSFTEADVGSANLPDLREYDVVHFAVLVGDSAAEKKRLLRNVAKAMKPGALILLRSTDSLRTILYPRVDIDEELLKIVSPVVATRYYGGSSSLTAIVVSVEEDRKEGAVANGNGHVNGNRGTVVNGGVVVNGNGIYQNGNGVHAHTGGVNGAA